MKSARTTPATPAFLSAAPLSTPGTAAEGLEGSSFCRSKPERHPLIARRARAPPTHTTTSILMPPRTAKKAAAPAAPAKLANPETDFAAGFVSVREMTTPVELSVQGRLPWYLQGNLYRIGPGIFDVYHADGARADREHWFDGIGVVFKFELDARGNRATFMSRTVCPEAVRAIEATAKADYKELSFGRGCGPARTLLGRLRAFLRPFTRDPESGAVPLNLNVTLEAIPGQGTLVARSDFAHSVALDPHTLRKRHCFSFRDLHPALRGAAAAAHSAHDAATGEVFNFAGGDWRAPRRYRVFRIAPDGAADVLADIDGEPGSHVHSVALTPGFVVLAISPWRADVLGMLVEGAVAPHLHFDVAKPTTFYVVSRAQRRVVGEFECKGFAAFHHVNAFEEADGGAVHVDVCRYQSADVLDQFYVRELRSRPAAWFAPVTPVRYSLRGLAGPGERMRKGTADARGLAAQRLELPCVAPRAEGRPYRFAYGVSHDDGHDDILANSLVKLDMVSGQSVSWQAHRCSVGEPTFVANPHGAREDDGVLVSVIVDAARQTSFMLVLDARTMKEVCRADTPQTVPHAFHGLYIPEEELE